MRFSGTWMILTPLLLSNLTAGAQAHTLESCFTAALKQSEIMAEDQEAIVQARERYRQALGAALPAVSLDAAAGWQTGASGQASAQLGARAPLFRGFREFAFLRQNEHLVAERRSAWQFAGLQLRLDVAEAFYAVLSLEQDLAHLGTQRSLYEDRLRDLKARVRIGRSRNSEVLSVQAQAAQLKAQEESVRGQLAVRRDLLGSLTGLPPETPLEAGETGMPEAGDLNTWLARTENRPDVQAAYKLVLAAREGVVLAHGAHWPSLDAEADYTLVRTDTAAVPDWEARVGLTLPLFAGGTLTAQDREADSVLRRAEWVRRRIRRGAADEVRSAYRSLTADLAQAAALQEAADLAHRNYQAFVRDYTLGLVSNQDVLNALTADQETRRALDRVRFIALTDRQRLDVAAAEPLALVGEPR